MRATNSDSDLEPASDGNVTVEADETGSITELPPSSKLVYKVLEYEGTMTQEQIADESRLCARTVRYALGKLEDERLVTSRVCLQDARQSKYQIAD